MTGPSKRKRPIQEEPAMEDSTPQALSKSGPIPLRSRKIRFNSTSPPPEIQDLAKEESIQPEDNEEDSEDDDAAPEAISLSTAHARSRAQDADVKRAAQARDEAAKKRRRERDARLKEQASQAKRAKIQRETEKDDKTAKSSALPALLPESLLDSIPAVRPPTPPLDQDREGSANGKEVLQNEHVYKGIVKLPSEKPVQDLQIGNLSVSVLEKKNDLLPPKADLKARATRENWLRGRAAMEGKKGKRKARKMERRPFGNAKTAFA